VLTISYSSTIIFSDWRAEENAMKMDRIELNPKVCNGKPIIRGTRIPVSVILEQIAEGNSWDDLLSGYPELKKEDIKAALLFARESIDHAEVRAANA
jgi:uncharacterized protein (DUF433 family)